jgi:hypothetical protein
MDALMDVFGPWLFGVSTILLVGGLLAKEMARTPLPRGWGEGRRTSDGD